MSLKFTLSQAMLAVAILSAAVVVVIPIVQRGWDAPQSCLLFGAGACCLAGFAGYLRARR